MADHPDIVEVLTEDHRRLTRLFSEWGKIADFGGQWAVTQQVVIELVQHMTAEEQILYPAVRNVLADGDELADRALAHHNHAERVMDRLTDTPADDANFHVLMRRLVNDVSHHMHFEETDVFERLQRRISRSDLASLGDKAAAAKRAAPTRPHPGIPDAPPFNRAAAGAVGIVDRVRDWLAGGGESGS